MDTIKGEDAIAAAELATKAGKTFTIAFYSYSRSTGKTSKELRTLTDCRTRIPLPHDKFSVDGVHYFLFEAAGVPKMCYRILIRYIGLPQDNYKLKQVIWYE